MDKFAVVVTLIIVKTRSRLLVVLHGISQGAVGLPDLLPSPGDSPFADCCLQAPAKAKHNHTGGSCRSPVAWTLPCLHVQSCSTLYLRGL